VNEQTLKVEDLERTSVRWLHNIDINFFRHGTRGTKTVVHHVLQYGMSQSCIAVWQVFMMYCVWYVFILYLQYDMSFIMYCSMTCPNHVLQYDMWTPSSRWLWYALLHLEQVKSKGEDDAWWRDFELFNPTPSPETSKKQQRHSYLYYTSKKRIKEQRQSYL